MVDFKDAMPELKQSDFDRDSFMNSFIEEQRAVKFIIDKACERYYFKINKKDIQIEQLLFGIKNDDGFEKAWRYLFEYMKENNKDRTEREILLYLYFMADEIKQGINEFTSME